MRNLTNLSQLSSGTHVVKFFAPWCNPCKMLNPIVEKVEQANPSVTFYSVNTDDQPDIAQHFGVTNIPAMFVVKDGKVVESIIGFKPFNDINTVVGKYV